MTKARVQSYEEKIKAMDEELKSLRARLSQYEQVGSPAINDSSTLQAVQDALEERRNDIMGRLNCTNGIQSEVDTDCQDPGQSDSDDEESSTSDSESSECFVATRSIQKKRNLTASVCVRSLPMF